MTDLEKVIDPPWNRHLQDLHRHFCDESADRCLLWVNPAQFDVFEEEVVAQDRMVRITINRPDINELLLPYLVPLDLSKSADADLFKKSVAIAWEAWTLDSLKAFNGQPIGGWIRTDTEPQTLAQYWATNCYVHTMQNARVLLRIHDPGVRQWLWRALCPLQKNQLLGPTHSIHAFGREQQLMCHQRDSGASDIISSAAGELPSRLRLTPGQSAQVRDYAALHRAWLRYREQMPAVREGEIGRAGWETDIFASLNHASRLGVQDEQDRDLFAFHALQMGPDFHTNKRLERVWELVRDGDYYGGACEQVCALPTDRLHEYLQLDEK